MPKYLIIFVASIIISSNAKAQNQSLDYYITAGLTNSPFLKDLNYQLLSTAIDSLLIKAGGKPQINLTSQATYAPSSKNYGYDEAITNGGNYSALLNFTQPLLNRYQKNVRLQSNSISGQTLRVNIKVSEIDLKKNITIQYLTAFSDYHVIQFIQTLLNLLKDQQSLLKQLVEKGIYQQTDYINLSLSIRAQAINYKQSFIQYKNDLGVLNFTCGIADTSSVDLQNPDIVVKNDFTMNNSPLFLQYQIDSIKNITNIHLIDVNYRPKLNAFADAGFNAIKPENIPNNFGGSIGLNFSIPIYDGRQRKMQYNKISLAENSRISQFQFYTTQFRQQRIQLTEQLRLTEELISDIEGQVSDQKKLIELYRIEMDKGIVRFLDYITVINNYSSTEINLFQKENERMQIINQMNYLK